MRFRGLALATCAFADVAFTLHAGRYCPLTCDSTLNYPTFNDTDSWLAQRVRSCRSDLRIKSFYLCIDWYCEFDRPVVSYIAEQSDWCSEHAGSALPNYREVINHWKAHHQENVARLKAEDAFKRPTLGQVVIPDSSLFMRAFTTIETAFQAYDLHLVYGWLMFYFWGAVVSVGICMRLLSFAKHHPSRHHAYQQVESGAMSAYPRTHSILISTKSWLKRRLLTPAAFGDRCSQPHGWYTVPPRVQSLTILAFVVFNIIMCSCSYKLTDGNIYWPKKSRQLLRFVSDRTGIISLANFPLVWLFGMRNDILMWMTGWSFGTYNAFHRWTARIATIQALAHSIGYTVMILDDEGWPSFLNYWTKHYFWNGELATMAMCAILACSFYGIRRAHYDMFLVTHIVLSIAVLWSMFYHVEIFTGGEYNVFLRPCIAIWILDRALRLGRILAFNRNPLDTTALVSYSPESNLVKMKIDSSKNLLAPSPGAYYYIHVLDDLLFAHQSHPFTLAFLSSDINPLCDTVLSPMASRSHIYRPSSALERASSESATLLTRSSESGSNMVFLVRPYDGFTCRLKSHCLLSPRRLRVLVDGPYGHTLPLHTFPSVLFIVGGTGVTVSLSHLSRLLASTSCVRKVRIVWAVREYGFLTSVLHDFAGLLQDPKVETVIHLTRGSRAREDIREDVLSEDLKNVEIRPHRPNVRDVVQDAAQEAGGQSLAIVCCGPALMADLTRKASVEMLGNGHHGIEYFEESFKW